MSDAIDFATDLSEREREAIIAARQRVEASRKPLRDEDLTDCRDCGEAIEPARRKALPFTDRCASCAHEAETFYRERAWKV